MGIFEWVWEPHFLTSGPESTETRCINKTVPLSVVYYGYKTCSLTLREKRTDWGLKQVMYFPSSVFLLWLDGLQRAKPFTLLGLRGHIRAHTHTHTHTRSVGLLWTRDQLVAETSTWQHTTFTTDRYPCLQRGSKPQSQQASGRRPTP
jgi:hypothetical protein